MAEPAPRRIETAPPTLIGVMGVVLEAQPEGVLCWADEKLLVVADLHLEKGSSFARRGQFLPPYDTGDTLARLGAAVERLRPANVVALGDSFHDGDGALRMSGHDRAALAGMQRGRNWIWVAGNHDPAKPAGLAGDHVNSLAIGRLAFRHEPSPDPAPGEIAGHLHPAARVAGRGRSVRRRCFVGDGERLVLPAFGAYAGGLNVLDRAFAGLFGRPFRAFVLGKERVYAVARNVLRQG
jgi:DNA ligase-associated metallophosphoesterase